MQLDHGFKKEATKLLSRRFSMIEENRKVGWCLQTKMIYQRNMTSAFRNPLQFMAVVALGLIQSFLLIMLFGGVGDEKIDSMEALNDSQGIILDWLGMVFLAASDQFVICSFAMCLMIPMAYPVFQREMGSHMYSPSAYFVANTCSNILVNMFYPFLVSGITFWFYGYPITNFGGFLCFLAV